MSSTPVKSERTLIQLSNFSKWRDILLVKDIKATTAACLQSRWSLSTKSELQDMSELKRT